MNKKDFDELTKMFEENETISNDFDSIWAIMLIALLFMPQKQEPPIINIYLGEDI
jgi:hypothetical protein